MSFGSLKQIERFVVGRAMRLLSYKLINHITKVQKSQSSPPKIRSRANLNPEKIIKKVFNQFPQKQSRNLYPVEFSKIRSLCPAK
jgi:hypothetical protein